MLPVGERMRGFLDRRMDNLKLKHLQCDEIWTFVLKKQAQLKPAEREDPVLGDQFLFVALDEATKLIPSFVLGKRTTENTGAFMDDLAKRIVVPPLVPARPAADGFHGRVCGLPERRGRRVRRRRGLRDYHQGLHGVRTAGPLRAAGDDGRGADA